MFSNFMFLKMVSSHLFNRYGTCTKCVKYGFSGTLSGPSIEFSTFSIKSFIFYLFFSNIESSSHFVLLVLLATYLN